MNDDNELVRNKMSKWLKEKGFESGALGWDPILHTKGFPGGTSLMVKPNYVPEGEACTILITPIRIYQMVIDLPFESKKWEINEARSYANIDELEDILEELMNENLGCWIEE